MARATKPKKAATKQKKQKKQKKTLETEWNVAGSLTLQEELLCRYYVQHESTRGNGTWSYNAAYQKHLEDQPTDDAVYDAEGKMVEASSYRKVESICSTEAARILRKPRVSKRIQELLLELFNDDFVDSQLVKVVAQDEKLDAKVAGIREYNKLKARITEKLEHSFAEDEREDSDIDKELARMEAFFKKKKL